MRNDMLGLIYMLLAVLTGKELAGFLLKERSVLPGKQNRLWVMMPAAFGCGVLLLTWALYVVSWIFSVVFSMDTPLLAGNIVVMSLAFAGLGILYIYRMRKGKPVTDINGLVEDRRLFAREMVFYGILLAFLTWIMFYVLFIRDGVLCSGYTVFSDYAPHTAMIRSFSEGNNFPTQYPHFGGEDVKYHFMFQFLVGNLEYLGLPLDVAYNLPSILALWGFLVILCQLAMRLTGSYAGTIAAVCFFFFRSGTAFFRFVWEHMQAGDLGQTLSENTVFIGYTTNENWGLWNFNVYLNQRHLAFGLLIVAIALWVFLDWVDAGCSCEEKGILWIRNRLFTKEAWKSRDLEKALVMGMILGLSSFWNGAAVIGGLLILMGFAAFSDGKLDYVLLAGTAVFFSVLQSKIFINGQAVSPALKWGFLSEDKSIAGVLWYLVQIGGITVAGLLVLVFFLNRRNRVVLVSFLFPMFFAFVMSLTPDIAVNHKYIMISWAFLTVFWGWAAAKLLEGKWWKKLAAVVLIIGLTATGVYDFVVIVKNNGTGHRYAVNLESSLTDWLEENLTSKDLILTPEYSISEVTMSGVMMYLGWPYYAWSAGYDTYYRAECAKKIYSTVLPSELKGIVEQENIAYILYEQDMELEGMKCREDVIADTYPLVYESEDGRVRIYETGLSVHRDAGLQ